MEIYKELNRVPGVVDTVDVQILHNTALSVDGRYLGGEIDTVFEMKYPFTDVQGSVT